MRALAMKIVTTPIALVAIALVLISPALAHAGCHYSPCQTPLVSHGCVSSPENSSFLLTVLGGISAFVIPVARQKFARKGQVAVLT
jgi:hypothetical protein